MNIDISELAYGREIVCPQRNCLACLVLQVLLEHLIVVCYASSSNS